MCFTESTNQIVKKFAKIFAQSSNRRRRILETLGFPPRNLRALRYPNNYHTMLFLK